ncbi:MAG: hypothetical protein KDJ52_22285 [Anaerolineae bacterium]|nr:hypothetical protein [Anaerolineae bacterium]MCB0212088.1 hypothetical protein [Anaerolineae bacterium]
MTLNDMSQPNPFLHDHAWQALIEFTLPRESNSAYVAADRVVEAMQRLNWPAALLEQLKFTLAGATGYVMARADYYGSETPLIIRVLIPKDDLVIREADQPGTEPNQGQASDRQTQQAGPSLARGWGYFLVQKQEDDPQPSTGSAHHTIELFLYRER